MKCLDTYALVEIYGGNKNFDKYSNEEFVINDLTLAEFFWVLLRDVGQAEAEIWHKKFEPYSYPVERKILIKAMIFRRMNRKKDYSFFDCVGYIFASENNIKFVTGDEGFRNVENVEFVK